VNHVGIQQPIKGLQLCVDRTAVSLTVLVNVLLLSLVNWMDHRHVLSVPSRWSQERGCDTLSCLHLLRNDEGYGARVQVSIQKMQKGLAVFEPTDECSQTISRQPCHHIFIVGSPKPTNIIYIHQSREPQIYVKLNLLVSMILLPPRNVPRFHVVRVN
jgi:hypothetical protein